MSTLPRATDPQEPMTIPWDYVKSTEHHGPYITSAYGCTICDFYFMNAGPVGTQAQRPIHHMFELADEHAAYAVRAANAHATLVGALRKVDAHWTEDFPGGPEGDLSYRNGVFQYVNGARLSDSTLEIWRAIRAALALAAEIPHDARQPVSAEAADSVGAP
jgi:hypothetical protein